MVILVNIIVMFTSFLMMICFMNDITTMIVNRKLVLYSMSFLLTSRIVHFTSFSIYWSWYLLFGTICKSKKPWKIFLYCFWSFQPLCYWVYLLWNWYTLPYHIQYSIFCISLQILLFDLNQIEIQPKCRLCKDDSTLKALEIYPFYSV